MKTIRIAIFVFLFCIFPARVMIQWAPLIGVPIVSSLFVLAEYTSLAYLFIRLFADRLPLKTNLSYWLVYFLFWIYYGYLIYYIMINPQMHRDDMSQVPDDTSIILTMIETGIAIPVIIKYYAYIDIKLFVKSSALFMTLVLLAYVLTSNMSFYLYEKTLSGAEAISVRSADLGLLSSLVLGEFCSIGFIFVFFAKDLWSNNRSFNKVLFWSFSSFLLILLLFFAQRGPVLFMVLTMSFYYYAKGKMGKVFLISVVVTVLSFTLFGDSVLQLVKKYDYSLIERFMNIGEDGGSGRFGDSDAVYNLSIKQILNEPFFGSYFRINIGAKIGYYPHNFILELLMTFGLFFSLPFFFILLRGVRNSFYAIKYDKDIAVFCLIFINVYFCHFTSYTMVNSNNMWILLAITSSLSIVRRYRTKCNR